MNMHPYVVSQLAAERHRELLAQARRQRLGHQLRALARAARQAERAEERLRDAVRKALRLRAELQH
jgi:hypothetical protein